MEDDEYIGHMQTTELPALGVPELERLAAVERTSRIAAWGCLIAALVLLSAALANLAS